MTTLIGGGSTGAQGARAPLKLSASGIIFTDADIKLLANMEKPAPKGARLSIEEVMLELDHDDDDGPMTVGSDNEFTCTKQQRDDWGIVDNDYNMITESPRYGRTPL